MKSWTILLSTLCLFSCNQQENKFEKYVDPLIGTDIRIVQGKTRTRRKNADKSCRQSGFHTV